MKKYLFVFISLLFVTIVFAKPLTIFPAPQKMELQTGFFTITRSTVISLTSKDAAQAIWFLNDYLQKMYGFRLQTTTQQKVGKAISFAYTNIGASIAGAYKLTVSNNGIALESDNAEGFFYAVQSLIQLLPLKQETKGKLPVPQLKIEDAPRFAYRGLMLDVSRHFMPVEFIKRYIDFIARFKLNVFHWHLTDDQGWRIEIKKYPKLTQIGAWRNGTIIGHHPGTENDNIRYGGFYTQEQVKDVVRYAATRHVTIIPEIEMPGHSSAVIAAYPFLSCFPNEETKILGKMSAESSKKQQNGQVKLVQENWGVCTDVLVPTDETFTFLENVLDEIMAMFPSKYIHIGGDECPKENWKRSEFCQNLIKEKKLANEHDLQAYFIARIEKYLNSKNRKIIGWDEILEGTLAPNATVMSWRGEKGGIEAAKQKHDVIMTPSTYCYFDYAQNKKEDSLVIGGFLPIEKVYDFNPLPAELNADEAKYILGAQANVWTEYMATPAKIEYMIFPRLVALSEFAWTQRENKNWDDFKKRLPELFKKLDAWKINYCNIF